MRLKEKREADTAIAERDAAIAERDAEIARYKALRNDHGTEVNDIGDGDGLRSSDVIHGLGGGSDEEDGRPITFRPFLVRSPSVVPEPEPVIPPEPVPEPEITPEPVPEPVITPAPVPEPVATALVRVRRLISQVTYASEVSPRWGAPKGLVGRVKSPEILARAYDNRRRVYVLLEDEDHQDALAATEKLNVMVISWWAALRGEMDVPTILNLPG